jgi:hypothetical protein
MKTLHSLCLITLLAAAQPAWASNISFNFSFSGAAYGGNTALANGTITFDDTKLANPGRNLWDPNNLYSSYGTATAGLVTGLSVTVTGLTGGLGDGTFNLTDFDAVLFDTSTIALDLAKQLMGQATSSPNGKTWGQDDPITLSNPPAFYTGDFQLFAKTGSAAPYGIYPFQVGTNGGNDDGMQLVSFAPASLPEPSTFLLVGLGLGVLAFAKKDQKAPS